MPFSMNNLASIPWQGLDTRPYTPGMFGGIVPMPDKPSYGPPIAQPGGGVGGINSPPPTWNPGGGPNMDLRNTGSLQATPPFVINTPRPQANSIPSAQSQDPNNPNIQYRNPIDFASPPQARQPFDIYGQGPQAQSPLASLPTNYWQSKAQQLKSGAGYTQPLDTATSNPITQAMQSFQSNLRSQVPQQYQQYLPANMGF